MIRHARKIVVGVIGFTILIFGLLVFPLPAPLGWIMVPLGLVILAGEFVWARRWLDAIQNRTGPVGRKMRSAEDVARRRASKILQRKIRTEDIRPPESVSDAAPRDGSESTASQDGDAVQHEKPHASKEREPAQDRA